MLEAEGQEDSQRKRESFQGRRATVADPARRVRELLTSVL